ncbi:MAG: VOC family protein [Paracoccus sp. (in: a-proteobacteria)]|uniref:VOC family protein n=1 Tax=Paracoccus sp. TaxID=267 RepID=UPI0039E36679
MLEGFHFQNAYVTRDLAGGIRKIEAMASVRKKILFETVLSVKTPEGNASLGVNAALLWVGNLQYELIEPRGGDLDVYTQALPEDDGIRFHHICMRVPDWDAFRARVDLQSMPLVMEGETQQVKYLYLDARASLGHYLEYYWTSDAHWSNMGGL